MECKICKKKLLDVTALRNHQSTHTGERPYKCDICGKRYTQNKSLREHMGKHMGTTFQCNRCQKVYTLKGDLKKHQKRKHPIRETMKCNVMIKTTNAEEVCAQRWLELLESGRRRRQGQGHRERRLNDITRGVYEMYWFYIGVNEKGRGVYAKTGLPYGEPVLVYGGHLLPETSDRLHNEYEHLAEYPGSYIYDFRYNGRSYCFDATADDGRMGRLLNHSKKGANLITKMAVVDGAPQLIFYTNRAIKVGEELMWDYSETDSETLRRLPFLKH